MTPWWDPFPCIAFQTDPRVRVLSRSARGVLAGLLAQSRGGATLPYVNHHTGVGTIAVITWCEGDTDGAVRAEVDELVAAELVALDDNARMIHLRLVEGTAVAAGPGGDVRATAPTGEGVVSPTTDRSSPRGRALASLKAHCSNRRLATREARLAWFDSADGRRVLERLGLSLDDARPIADAAGRRGGRFGGARDEAAQELGARGKAYQRDGGKDPVSLTSETAVSPVVSPAPPPEPPTPTQSPENTEKIGSEGAGEDGGKAGGKHFGKRVSADRGTGVPDDGGKRAAAESAPLGPDASAGDAGPLGATRCGTVESLGLDAEVLLQTLRERTRRARPALNLAFDARMLVTWTEKVRELARLGRSTQDFEALADWIVAGGLSWWTHGSPSLAYLLAPGRLAQLLEDAAQWNAAGRPALPDLRARGAVRPPPAKARPAPPDYAPQDPELRAIFEMEQRQRAMP